MDARPLDPRVSGVVAIVVTHRRPQELRRLLDGLETSAVPLLGCVIVDHEAAGAVKALEGKYRLQVIVREDASNPGPGAGWANGTEEALRVFGREVDSLWYLDDDVVLGPDVLGILLDEMERSHACAIAPLLSDSAGSLWAFPEPVPKPLRRLIREVRTPQEALEKIGPRPVEACWATGACFLVKRLAVEVVGPHRRDFWMLGEDLEFSMRLSAVGRLVFTCQAVVPHLPPVAADAGQARRSDYRKFVSLLQNLAFLSFHAPHSRHMRTYLAGNFRRFFRTHGLGWGTCRDAVLCFWNGALGGHPAGHVSGRRLRERKFGR